MQTQALCGVCLCINIVIVIILIMSSFSSLAINELGLNYSGITVHVENRTYESGFYFLGVSHSFLVFPKIVQQIEFSYDEGSILKSRTKDGLEVDLEISFQYRLNQDEIYSLYQKYQQRYNHAFERIAIDVLAEHASQYDAYEFFVNRTAIGQSMHMKLNSFFTKNSHASIEFFQLRSVDLPDKFENSISETEVQKQSIQKAEAEKEKTQVELDTLVKKAEYQKRITIIRAEAEAIEYYQNGLAESQAIVTKQNITSQAYKQVKDQLHMDDKDIIDYVERQVVRKHKPKGLVVNMNQFRSSQL